MVLGNEVYAEKAIELARDNEKLRQRVAEWQFRLCSYKGFLNHSDRLSNDIEYWMQVLVEVGLELLSIMCDAWKHWGDW